MYSFELLSHTADTKIRVVAGTQQELFIGALNGMFSIMQPVVVDDAKTQERRITIRSPDIESLLIDFLSEALYMSDVHNEWYDRVSFAICTGYEIDAILYARKIKRFAGVEVKSVTYHELEVKHDGGLWHAVIVFDI